MVVVAVLALLLAAVAAGFSVVSLRRTTGLRGLEGPDAPPADVLGLRQEVAALRAEAKGAFKHLAVVRYDAFGDMGGHLSWSLALVDDGGDGVVLTAIHGRQDSRSYAKNVSNWSCEQQLSPEEAEALSHAKTA